jgi:hypothetical protein
MNYDTLKVKWKILKRENVYKKFPGSYPYAPMFQLEVLVSAVILTFLFNL